MLTTEKSINEMSQQELAEEYRYCINAADQDVYDATIKQYFRDRAETVKKHLLAPKQ